MPFPNIFSFFIISDELKATQALELLGVISIAFALLLAILKRSVMQSQEKLPLVAGILAVCSGMEDTCSNAIFVQYFCCQVIFCLPNALMLNHW